MTWYKYPIPDPTRNIFSMPEPDPTRSWKTLPVWPCLEPLPYMVLKSQQLSLLSILSVSIGWRGGEPFWVDPPEGWYHVALCRLADFFANHNYKKVKVKNHLFVPSNTNGQSLQVGPKTCFLTSHHVNRMLGSKNPSKIQNWHPNFFSSTTIP